MRAKPGVNAPEFPDVCIGGWTGTIIELTGKKAQLNCVVEWDEQTVERMPAAFLQGCEAKGMYHKMAFLSGTDIELVTE